MDVAAALIRVAGFFVLFEPVRWTCWLDTDRLYASRHNYAVQNEGLVQKREVTCA